MVKGVFWSSWCGRS